MNREFVAKGTEAMSGLIVVIARNSASQMHVAGVVTRDVAHTHGVPHGTALVAVVVAKREGPGRLTPQILLHRRSPRKRICPNRWDICGGHLEADAQTLDSARGWDNPGYLERLFRNTALREVNEECLMVAEGSAHSFRFEASHLQQFGDIGAFENGFDDPAARNREYSTFYVALVPPAVLTVEPLEQAKSAFRVVDSIPGPGGEEEVTELDLLPLAELVSRFQQNKCVFADGVARIVSHALREPATMQTIDEFLQRGIGAR